MTRQTTVPLDRITNTSPNREMGDLSGLKQSIQEIGLICPLAIDETGKLLAGHRRYQVLKELNYELVPVIVFNTDPVIAHRVTLDENLHRKPLTDPENAVIIKQFHEILRQKFKQTQNESLVAATKAKETNETNNYWNQESTAEVLGVSRRVVGKAIQIAEAVEQHPEWAKDKGKQILRRIRLERDGFNPTAFNIWNFPNCDPRFGKEGYPGRIPGQIVQNLLYHFLDGNESAIIIDPMAGSGTTHDVVNWYNEHFNTQLECLSYDVRSPPARKFIQVNDISEGYPPECQECDIVFLDPYYYDMGPIQFKSLKAFGGFLTKLAKDTKAILKPRGTASLLMADWTKDEFCYLRGMAYRIFSHFFDEPIAVIAVPFSTSQAEPQEVNKAKEERKLLGRDRTLFVWRREP